MNLQEIVTKRTGKAISQCSNKELYFSLLEMTKGMAEEKVSNEGKRKLYYISAACHGRCNDFRYVSCKYAYNDHGTAFFRRCRDLQSL